MFGFIRNFRKKNDILMIALYKLWIFLMNLHIYIDFDWERPRIFFMQINKVCAS